MRAHTYTTCRGQRTEIKMSGKEKCTYVVYWCEHMWASLMIDEVVLTDGRAEVTADVRGNSRRAAGRYRLLKIWSPLRCRWSLWSRPCLAVLVVHITSTLSLVSHSIVSTLFTIRPLSTHPIHEWWWSVRLWQDGNKETDANVVVWLNSMPM